MRKHLATFKVSTSLVTTWSLQQHMEHDNILHRVLSRAHDKGVKFNSEKVHVKIGQVEYMCNLVSSDRWKPDPKKIESIMNMPKPTDVNRYSVSWDLSSILLSRPIFPMNRLSPMH